MQPENLMDCNESRNLLAAHADGELDPASAAAHADHLATCAECNDAYKKLIDLRATIKTHATRHVAPRSLIRSIMAELDAGGDGHPARRKRPWAWINAAVATACSVGFAVSLSLYLTAPSNTERLDQEIVASHVRSLLADHLADVASSDQHTVKPWFSGKLDYVPPVVDLASQGFPLVGGRLDYVDRKTVAALAYRHGKHLVNLFVWPDRDRVEAPARSTSVQGFQLLQWTHAGMAYRAVSDTNPGELASFRELLLAQNSAGGQSRQSN
jgi:anti-sigma factor RsiW